MASTSGSTSSSGASTPSTSTSTSPSASASGPSGPSGPPSSTIGALDVSKTLNQSFSGLSSSLASIGKIFFGFPFIDNNNTKYRYLLFGLWLAYALIVFSTVSDLPYNQTKFTIYCCSIWFVLLALLFLFS
jgi:hypothetical protein